MKKNFVKFTCDYCKKDLMRESGSNAFPYEKGWQYIYNLKGRTLDCYAPGIQTDLKEIAELDKHFCSMKCLLEWIVNQFTPNDITIKDKKQVLKECVEVYRALKKIDDLRR